MLNRLDLRDEVAAALDDNRPVVALESSILAHGLPSPLNVEVASGAEAAIRQAGAVPATVAVIDGIIRVGISPTELTRFGNDRDIPKLSRADLPLALACGWTGATTVAATMIGARLAGIRVFATGGIGGVHRGANRTFDISADLQELATSPVLVVASGAKAILDIPKTLEYLETCGVTVVTYRHNQFPAFWARNSDVQTPARLDAPETIAKAFQARCFLGIGGGMLVANPVSESHAIPSEQIECYIEMACNRAADLGVTGKRLTPFLLTEISKLSAGKTLQANARLVLDNARLAADIAMVMAQAA